MARPRKRGLDYFPFDIDFFSDKKIRILKARYGTDGITLYVYLLCETYKNGYYLQMDNDFEYIISDDLSMSSDKVKQVLNFLLERSLFDDKLFQSDKVLTSAGIQRRFQEAVKSRAVKTPIEISKFWILSREETQSYIKVSHLLSNSKNNKSNSKNNENNSKINDIKKRKEKKSKVDIKDTGIKPSLYFENVNLNNTFLDFMEMRKAIKSKMTDRAISLMVNKINKLNDPNTAVKMLEQSIMNSWKDIYPLKEDDEVKAKAINNSNKFNQFPQRKYSQEQMSEIEKKLLNKGL